MKSHLDIKIIYSVKQFSNLYIEILQAEEASNQIFLQTIEDYIECSSNEVYMGAIVNDNVPIILFFMPYQYDIQIYCIRDTEKGLELLFSHLIKNETFTLSGFIICDKYATIAKNYIEETGYMKASLHFSYENMVLYELPPISSEHYIMKHASIETLDYAAYLYQLFEKECCKKDYPLDSAKRKIYKKIQNRECFILYNKNSNIVATAHVDIRLKAGIVFSGLYSVKEYRNQGFATSLLLQMCHYYIKNGITHCYLCADTDQPELKHLYAKIGFKTVSTNQGYRIHNMK